MGCPPPYRESLIANLREAPSRFRRAYEGLDQADLGAHPIIGKWSPGEFAEHIAIVDLGWTDIFAESVYRFHPELGRQHQPGWSSAAQTLARSGLAGAFAAMERNHDQIIAYLERLPEDRFDHVYPPVQWLVEARLDFVIKESVNWGLAVHLDHHLPFLHRTRVALGKGLTWMEQGPWARDLPPPPPR